MNITRTAFRTANYVVLILSFAGLFLVCSSIMGEEITLKFAISFLPQITVGYAVMILFTEVLRFPIRAKLTHFVAGVLYAFALFMIGVFAASVTSMFVYQDFDSSSYIVRPVLGLGIYGFIPALIIGFIGSALLRIALKKSEEKTVVKNRSSAPTLKSMSSVRGSKDS